MHGSAGRVYLHNVPDLFTTGFEDEDTFSRTFEEEAVAGFALFQGRICPGELSGPVPNPLFETGVFPFEIPVHFCLMKGDLDLGPDSPLIIGLDEVPIGPGPLCPFHQFGISICGN